MKKGILLANLGSPDSTSVSDVRKYLREFLMDAKVIDSPYLIRKLVVELAILPKRPKESAHAYASIWTDEGSPLVVYSQKLKKAIEASQDLPVALGMRYGSMNLKKAMQELKDQDVTDVLFIPLYPQYTMSSTETMVDKANEVRKKHFPEMRVKYLKPFYNHPDYVQCLAQHIQKKLPKDFDCLLFSFHGIPERHDKKALQNAKKFPNIDIKTYRDQCFETTKLVTEVMQLPEEKVKVSFQSRLGKDPWIKPYTDFVLTDFPKEGVKKLAVVTPAFVSDCLETLEEIAIRGKEDFLTAGGETFDYIECLNIDPLWIEVLTKWIDGWKNSQ